MDVCRRFSSLFYGRFFSSMLIFSFPLFWRGFFFFFVSFFINWMPSRGKAKERANFWFFRFLSKGETKTKLFFWVVWVLLLYVVSKFGISLFLSIKKKKTEVKTITERSLLLFFLALCSPTICSPTLSIFCLFLLLIH